MEDPASLTPLELRPVEDPGAGPPPPPSPLSGCYLLIVIGEPHSEEHKEVILQRIAKGFLSWDPVTSQVDLEKELQALTAQAPEGEEARNGERLIQYATENLVTEVLIHPQVNTLVQCVRNLLSSFTRHRHLIHAGYTFAGNGSWILQDGTFSLADFADAFQESEVQRILRAYENSVTVDVHCMSAGVWSTERMAKESFTRYCKVRVNPGDVLTADSAPINNFINYITPFLKPATIEELLEPSDVVGNIRFSHPTLYVFPGGQGDAALFGINGFNMLVDGGFGRKSCFWDFARHLDRLDAILMTRLNNGNVSGIASLMRRKKQNHVYPQIGHFFCNLQERRLAASPDGDKDQDPLLVNLSNEGQEIVLNLRNIQLRAHCCYREGNNVEPVNLYHKVGHGKLDMYVISPIKDSREVKEFLAKWNANDAKLFTNAKKDSKEFLFPLQNLVSICALLVWQPANPNDTITRILFPGSTPQHKIFEGLEKLKHLEFLKHPVCSMKSITPSGSTVGISSKVGSKIKSTATVLDKLLPGEKESIKEASQKAASMDANKQVKATTIPVVAESKSTKLSSLNATPQTKAPPIVKNKTDKPTSRPEPLKKTEANKSLDSDKTSSKTEKTTKVIEKKTETKPKIETKSATTKPKVEIKPARSVERRITTQKVTPTTTEKKSEKASPTTPKKSVESKINAASTKIEASKVNRSASATRGRPSPTGTPAKSAKDANNRKVVESKINVARVSSTARVPAKLLKKEDVKAERKPIARKPKTSPSPIKRGPGSPAKSSVKGSSATSGKSDKEGAVRKIKADADKGGTDSSSVSTPSTADQDLTLLKAKEVIEKSSALLSDEPIVSTDTVLEVQSAAAGMDEGSDDKSTGNNEVEISESGDTQVVVEKEKIDAEDNNEDETKNVEETVEAHKDDHPEELENDKEAPVDEVESLANELDIGDGRTFGEEVEGDEGEEEEEYLIIEKEEIEISLQEQESVDSHAQDADEGYDIDADEDGELKKQRDEVESEKEKKEKNDGADNSELEVEKETEVVGTVNDLEPSEIEQIEVKENESVDIQREDVLQQKEPVVGLDSIEGDSKLNDVEQENIKEEEEEKVDNVKEIASDVVELGIDGVISQEHKEKIEEEVQEIISSAKDIVSSKKHLDGEIKVEEDEKDEGSDRKKSSEEGDEAKELSSISPEEKLDNSSEKNREATDDNRETTEDDRDTDQRIFDQEHDEYEIKRAATREAAEHKYLAEESQPDERFSTTVESAATTAPTLPEDERIPLDEIKEIIEEKHIKEDTKEKETPAVVVMPRYEQPTTLPQVVMSGGATVFPAHGFIHHRDIVKTPDEVADLPVHEEVDPGMYESGEFTRDFHDIKDDSISSKKQDSDELRRQSPELEITGELQLKDDEKQLHPEVNEVCKDNADEIPEQFTCINKDIIESNVDDEEQVGGETGAEVNDLQELSKDRVEMLEDHHDERELEENKVSEVDHDVAPVTSVERIDTRDEQVVEKPIIEQASTAVADQVEGKEEEQDANDDMKNVTTEMKYVALNTSDTEEKPDCIIEDDATDTKEIAMGIENVKDPNLLPGVSDDVEGITTKKGDNLEEDIKQVTLSFIEAETSHTAIEKKPFDVETHDNKSPQVNDDLENLGKENTDTQQLHVGDIDSDFKPDIKDGLEMVGEDVKIVTTAEESTGKPIEDIVSAANEHDRLKLDSNVEETNLNVTSSDEEQRLKPDTNEENADLKITSSDSEYESSKNIDKEEIADTNTDIPQSDVHTKEILATESEVVPAHSNALSETYLDIIDQIQQGNKADKISGDCEVPQEELIKSSMSPDLKEEIVDNNDGDCEPEISQEQRNDVLKTISSDPNEDLGVIKDEGVELVHSTDEPDSNVNNKLTIEDNKIPAEKEIVEESNLELVAEETVYGILEAPEHPEIVTMTPDSAPSSPRNQLIGTSKESKVEEAVHSFIDTVVSKDEISDEEHVINVQTDDGVSKEKTEDEDIMYQQPEINKQLQKKLDPELDAIYEDKPDSIISSVDNAFSDIIHSDKLTEISDIIYGGTQAHEKPSISDPVESQKLISKESIDSAKTSVNTAVSSAADSINDLIDKAGVHNEIQDHEVPSTFKLEETEALAALDIHSNLSATNTAVSNIADSAKELIASSEVNESCLNDQGRPSSSEPLEHEDLTIEDHADVTLPAVENAATNLTDVFCSSEATSDEDKQERAPSRESIEQLDSNVPDKIDTFISADDVAVNSTTDLTQALLGFSEEIKDDKPLSLETIEKKNVNVVDQTQSVISADDVAVNSTTDLTPALLGFSEEIKDVKPLSSETIEKKSVNIVDQTQSVISADDVAVNSTTDLTQELLGFSEEIKDVKPLSLETIEKKNVNIVDPTQSVMSDVDSSLELAQDVINKSEENDQLKYSTTESVEIPESAIKNISESMLSTIDDAVNNITDFAKELFEKSETNESHFADEENVSTATPQNNEEVINKHADSITATAATTVSSTSLDKEQVDSSEGKADTDIEKASNSDLAIGNLQNVTVEKTNDNETTVESIEDLAKELVVSSDGKPDTDRGKPLSSKATTNNQPNVNNEKPTDSEQEEELDYFESRAKKVKEIVTNEASVLDDFVDRSKTTVETIADKLSEKVEEIMKAACSDDEDAGSEDFAHKVTTEGKKSPFEELQLHAGLSGILSHSLDEKSLEEVKSYIGNVETHLDDAKSKLDDVKSHLDEEKPAILKQTVSSDLTRKVSSGAIAFQIDNGSFDEDDKVGLSSSSDSDEGIIKLVTSPKVVEFLVGDEKIVVTDPEKKLESLVAIFPANDSNDSHDDSLKTDGRPMTPGKEETSIRSTIATDDLETTLKPVSKDQDISQSASDNEEGTVGDEAVDTVKRMLVTASSEDGGTETEVCPTGSITFKASLSTKPSSDDLTSMLPDKEPLDLYYEDQHDKIVDKDVKVGHVETVASIEDGTKQYMNGHSADMLHGVKDDSSAGVSNDEVTKKINYDDDLAAAKTITLAETSDKNGDILDKPKLEPEMSSDQEDTTSDERYSKEKDSKTLTNIITAHGEGLDDIETKDIHSYKTTDKISEEDNLVTETVGSFIASTFKKEDIEESMSADKDFLESIGTLKRTEELDIKPDDMKSTAIIQVSTTSEGMSDTKMEITVVPKDENDKKVDANGDHSDEVTVKNTGISSEVKTDSGKSNGLSNNSKEVIVGEEITHEGKIVSLGMKGAAAEEIAFDSMGGISGIIAGMKKQDSFRSGTPGSDDIDMGGPLSPMSDISSGQVSRVPDSRNFESDVDDDAPETPGSMTSQHVHSPLASHFQYDIGDSHTSQPIDIRHTSSTLQYDPEHARKLESTGKDTNLQMDSSMTSSFYGQLAPDPLHELLEEREEQESAMSYGMQSQDPMTTSFYSSQDTYSPMDAAKYGGGYYREFDINAHVAGDSEADSGEFDFDQAVREHRTARGMDITSSPVRTHRHESKHDTQEASSPSYMTKYEQYSTAGTGKYHAEFSDGFGNGNVDEGHFDNAVNINKNISETLNGKAESQASTSDIPLPSVYLKESTSCTTKDVVIDSSGKVMSTSSISDIHDPKYYTEKEPSATDTSKSGINLPAGKPDPIQSWGKPLGLPSPAPPPVNTAENVAATNKVTPKKEKKVLIIKKSVSDNKTGLKEGVSRKRPESPVKQADKKGVSNKEGSRIGKATGNPIYMDLAYVPHHGNSHYSNVEFFKKVRARYYVFSGTEPSRDVYNALLEAKQTWDDKELEVTIIPTYDTDTLGYWVAENEDILAKHKIDLSPSASRCTINLQDHETSCSAYRLEF